MGLGAALHFVTALCGMDQRWVSANFLNERSYVLSASGLKAHAGSSRICT